MFRGEPDSKETKITFFYQFEPKDPQAFFLK